MSAIRAQIEASSLGTPAARAARMSVPDEEAARIVARANAMHSPQGIQRLRSKGWRMPANTVYVGRPSKWGNPFKVGDPIRLGDPLWPYIAGTIPGGPRGLVSLRPLSVETVVNLHAWWFIEQPALMLTVEEELGGRDLACWCKVGEPCHRDFLLAMAAGEAS